MDGIQAVSHGSLQCDSAAYNFFSMMHAWEQWQFDLFFKAAYITLQYKIGRASSLVQGFKPNANWVSLRSSPKLA